MTQLNDHQKVDIHREMERLSSKYGLQGELLNVAELAKVIGKSVRDLWNMKARGSMPPIPVVRMGGRDHFRLMHVAMFTLGMPFHNEVVSEVEPLPKTAMPPSANVQADAKLRKSRRRSDQLDDYIERQAMELLQAKNPKVWGTGKDAR